MYNPQETRTVESIVKSVRLFLYSDLGGKRICILVEGSEDAKIYSQFFKNVRTNVMVIRSTGKPKTEEAMQILSTETRRAIGICDADFFHLDKDYPAIANIFFTDYHDIEMTMLKFTDVFYNACSEFSLLDDVGEIMRDALQRTSYMAYTRWYSKRNHCNLSFKGLDYTGIFKVWDGKIEQDDERLINVLNQRSSKKTESIAGERVNIFIRENQTDDVFSLCNGHDVTALIALILEDKTKTNILREDYCNVLQRYFQLNHFMQTKLYANILSWQKDNRFDLLKTQPGVSNG
jgi:hypothetical protein